MRVKVTFTKNFCIKTSTKQPWTPDSNTTVMKKNKAMAQEIRKISSLYLKNLKNSSQNILEKYNSSIAISRARTKWSVIFVNVY